MSSSWIDSVVDLLERKKLKYAVVLVVIASTIISATNGALKLSDSTKNDFSPTKQLRSHGAYQSFQEHIPSFVASDIEVVYIAHRGTQSEIVNNDTQRICAEISDSLEQITSEAVISLDSYYTLLPKGPTIADQYLSVDRTSMVFAATVNLAFDKPVQDFVKAARSRVSDIATKWPAYQVVMTGRLTTSQISQKKSGKGFALSDGVGLPFIAVLFWWQVGSLRLLLIPALALGASLMCSWAVGYSLTHHYAVASYVPNIMLFLCLALSIDYSFFLLTRFQEERRKGESMTTSVSRMLRYSGATVLVSGMILVVTWLALVFFPVFGLDSAGLCSAATVFLCVVVNLTLTPALLLTFKGFFSHGGFFMFGKCRNVADKATSMEPESPDSPLLDGRAQLTHVNGYGAVSDSGMELMPKKKKSCYHRVAARVTLLPYSILVPLCVYAVFLAGCLQLRDLELSVGLTTDFGSGPAADAYNTVLKDFPSGVFQTPFALLGVASSNTGTIFTQSYFEASCGSALLLADPQRVPGTVPRSIDGVTVVFGERPTCLNLSQAIEWATAPTTTNDTASLSYQYKLSKYSNTQTNRSAIAGISPAFNPFSARVKQFVSDIRGVVDEYNTDPKRNLGVRFWTYHPEMVEVDAENFTVQRFPAVLTGTLLLIFGLISLRFKAALIPIKLIFTIVVPILFVYGLAVLVYQKGALNWLGLSAFKSGAGGISWLEPVSNVFLLIGLALDYDIFLFSRVYELRSRGTMNTRSCIIKAVDITGPVISAAGVIMALAFSGMVVSSNRFLNQFGFIMIVGVLLDTFVVRVILVPAVLSLVDWFNWWPTRMPQVSS